ncbi:MAG: hypothetical protein M3509_02660 [Chloroflexota bacterium]|nr:hypothetical protein [Chloroflexota bacterium]
MNILFVLHDRLAVSMVLFMGAAGVWGLIAYARGGRLGGSLAGTFVIGQMLVTLQVLAGVVLAVAGARPAGMVHYLYGVTAVLVLPFAWSFLRERDQRQALLVYSLIALFVAGLAIRGITTA